MRKMDDIYIWAQWTLITGIKGEILKNMVALSAGFKELHRTGTLMQCSSSSWLYHFFCS
jgi:hypothetical protein